jgi:UDP-2-acetamido-3-amino-2,3-dideoxy-glucuronate N-acetyltransferase
MSDSVSGNNCNFGQNLVISPGVIVGNKLKIQNNVRFYTSVCCEDIVFLGPSFVFTNVINPRSAINRKSEYDQTFVDRFASIGANTTIVCGHNIRKYAFFGVGVDVTK